MAKKQKAEVVSKKHHESEVRQLRQTSQTLSDDWSKARKEAGQYQMLAEGLGRLLWGVVCQKTTARLHVDQPEPGKTCGHCRASSLFASLSAATGKRPREWSHWTTSDYEGN